MSARPSRPARLAPLVLLCLATVACSGRTPSAAGPLRPPATFGTTCMPSNGESRLFTAMDQLTNTTSRSIRFVSARLMRSRNVTLDAAFAWPPDRWVSIFPLETVQHGLPPMEGFDEHWRAARPLEGYVLEPGQSIALGLAYTVGDVSVPAAWSVTRVLYVADGRIFRYDSPIAEIVMPETCLEIDDPSGYADEVIDG